MKEEGAEVRHDRSFHNSQAENIQGQRAERSKLDLPAPLVLKWTSMQSRTLSCHQSKYLTILNQYYTIHPDMWPHLDTTVYLRLLKNT